MASVGSVLGQTIKDTLVALNQVCNIASTIHLLLLLLVHFLLIFDELIESILFIVLVPSPILFIPI